MFASRKVMKKINKMSEAQLFKLKIAASRKSQKEQGFFDGRFVQRAEPTKKIYNRKQKHSKNSED